MTLLCGDALRIAEKCGIAACEISGWDSAPCVITDRPYFLDVVRRLKEQVDLPLIEVGGIRSAADVEAVLDAGAVAASVSRPLLSSVLLKLLTLSSLLYRKRPEPLPTASVTPVLPARLPV